MQPTEIVEEHNAEGCNHRLGLGFTLLKIVEGPVYVMGNMSGKTRHTWTYARSVQLAPYQNFKVSSTREFDGSVCVEEAGRLLYNDVEANIERVAETLRREGKIRE